MRALRPARRLSSAWTPHLGESVLARTGGISAQTRLSLEVPSDTLTASVSPSEPLTHVRLPALGRAECGHSGPPGGGARGTQSPGPAPRCTAEEPAAEGRVSCSRLGSRDGAGPGQEFWSRDGISTPPHLGHVMHTWWMSGGLAPSLPATCQPAPGPATQLVPIRVQCQHRGRGGNGHKHRLGSRWT